MKRRIELTKELAFGKDNGAIEVRPEGKSDVARMFSALWTGEFASIYLALLRGVDPGAVPIIDELKRRMKGRTRAG